MSVDLGFTAIFLSFSFFRQLPAELAERNLTKTGHMLGSKCDLKVNIRNLGLGPISPINRGPKPRFSTTLQLNGQGF